MKIRENNIPKYIYLVGVVIALKLLPITVLSQGQALVNQGSNLYIEGDGTNGGSQSLYISGDYVNLDQGASNGEIELVGGKIFITNDWINYAGNNVFTNFSGNTNDGFVTMGSLTNTQLIAGFNPTHFENLFVMGSRKNLAVDAEVNGRFILDCTFDLLGNSLTIDNPNPAGITYQSGLIKSETLPGNHGYVHWKIGSALGIYNVPFGSEIDFPNKDLNVGLNVKTPMGNSDFISFATYPTDGYNNPLPGFTPLETEIMKVVDRYWIIRPSNPLAKPQIDLSLSFNEHDYDDADNIINPEKLKAIRNNTDINRWLDMDPVGYESNSRIIANNISSFDVYDYWTLIEAPAPLANFFIPDAFTPNGDGLNDHFYPVFHTNYEIITYNFYIYDRWGKVAFHTTDETRGWDGKINDREPAIGVYSWVIIVKGKFSDNRDGEGVLEKHVGKVVLYK